MAAKKILILGASGMLGHTLFTQLSRDSSLDVYGTIRNYGALQKCLAPGLLNKLRPGVDGDNFDTVIRAFASIQPEVVINCIGLIKQLPLASDPLTSINVNSQLPHRISMVCKTAGARMIHMSTDCVFSGNKGNYTEEDQADPVDLYGRTKLLGEVVYPHCVTLRTSIIGHELKGKFGLIEWFLAQEGKVRGFTHAIYSGFPTVEMANIILKYVIPNTDLSGLYHVSAAPISKFDLLRLVAERYGKQIEIEKDDGLHCDRSIDSSRFRKATGYIPPSWHELADKMYKNFISATYYRKQ